MKIRAKAQLIGGPTTGSFKKIQFTKFGRVFDLLQNANAIVLKSWYVVEEVRFS